MAPRQAGPFLGPRGSGGHGGLPGSPQLGRVVAELQRDAVQLDVVTDSFLGCGDDRTHVDDVMDLDVDAVGRAIPDRTVQIFLVDGDAGRLDVHLLHTLRLDRFQERGHLRVGTRRSEVLSQCGAQIMDI